MLENALAIAERRQDLNTQDADAWRSEAHRIFVLEEKIISLRRTVRDFVPRLIGDAYDADGSAAAGALYAAAHILEHMARHARSSAAFYRERA